MDGTMDEVTEQMGRPTVTVGKKNNTREVRGKDTVDDDITALQGRLTVSVDTKSNKRPFRFMEQSDQLLPGIPDEITLNQIVPRMQWRVFHILSLVSHGWQQAIQSRQVHDARVRSKLTDTFLVIDGVGQIVLYSLRDKYFYQLPEIPNPQLEREDPGSWKWIALDGRLYCIGGLLIIENKWYGSPEVYVLDLAGQREWKKCATMEEGRYAFGSGLLGGRIYVFGGWNCGNPVCGAEVYDTKENSWSAISPGISWRCKVDVAALGEELVLFNGRGYDQEHVRGTPYNDRVCLEPVRFWEIYHPVKDEWHMVRPPVGQNGWGTVFMSEGKFFVMIDDDLDVQIEAYDYDKKTWSHLHSSSFAGIAGITAESKRYDVIAVNGELFVAVCNFDYGKPPELLLRI